LGRVNVEWWEVLTDAGIVTRSTALVGLLTGTAATAAVTTTPAFRLFPVAFVVVWRFGHV
jgi:hypothetical protein